MRGAKLKQNASPFFKIINDKPKFAYQGGTLQPFLWRSGSPSQSSLMQAPDSNGCDTRH